MIKMIKKNVYLIIDIKNSVKSGLHNTCVKFSGFESVNIFYNIPIQQTRGIHYSYLFICLINVVKQAPYSYENIIIWLSGSGFKNLILDMVICKLY